MIRLKILPTRAEDRNYANVTKNIATVFFLVGPIVGIFNIRTDTTNVRT